jgi:NAD(P)-dependent dehydrogenase (short-subunit alcohol dehydrogenase family)
VHALAVNVASESDCERLVAAHSERFGRLDVLVNSAGVGIAGTTADLPLKHWDLQFGVNVRSIFLLSQLAVPLLRESRGLVVNLASIAGTIPTPGLAVYGATKSALISFTNSLNREEAEHGVRATAISPAFVATKMTEWTGLPVEEQISTDDIVELVRAVLRLSPMARVPNIVVERVGDEV